METRELYSDTDLLLLLKAGNKQGLEVLFRRYYQPLCRFASLILKDPAHSEDVVQEMFVRLWENTEKLRVENVKAYLYRAVKNASLNQLDKTQRLAFSSDEIPERYYDSDNSDSALLTSELKDKIAFAINSLPAQCRLIFQMSRQEEMSQREIAEHLGISIKTVENQMGKALKLLREKLKPYLNDKAIGLFMGTLFMQ